MMASFSSQKWLFHYTDQKSYKAIQGNLFIKMIDGSDGPGVYFTDMNPETYINFKLLEGKRTCTLLYSLIEL